MTGTVVVCFRREAVLLGPASTAVQRAGPGRRGRPCRQADGQVRRKVSQTETALPVRREARGGGNTMVGKSCILMVLVARFHTYVDVCGGGRVGEGKGRNRSLCT